MKAKNKKSTSHAVLSRPPIVAVLGHVDHGKTTLLDTIRKSNVAVSESGGITQHIGAYQVEVPTKDGNKKITFIDTPGHEAFSKMRSRGAAVTDLVVLVISAVDGVQPQTEESLAHIKDAGVPFIVAATKMDLAEANVDRVKKHLAKINILTENYGGEIVVVPVSSTTKKGINELLEMILLIAEMKGLEGKDSDSFYGVIIESKLDNHRGPLATIIVKRGTLTVGQEIYLGEEKIKIRAMYDEYGKNLQKAYSSSPIAVLGFSKIPEVGSMLRSEKSLLDVKKEIKPIVPVDDKKRLKIILKADTFGSLEAIVGKFDDNIQLVEASVGEIGESEILTAAATKAFVIGFNVKITKSAKKLADQEKVLVKTYTIIYDLLEELYDVSQLVIEGEKEIILGEGKVLAVFSTSAGKIAGIRVISGRLVKGDKIKLVRGEKDLGTGRILGLKKGKEDAVKVELGEECGAKLSANLDFLPSDMVLSLKINEIKLT